MRDMIVLEIVKFAASIGVAIVGFGGVILSIKQNARNADLARTTADAARALESRKPFFQKQLDFCSEATAAAARIASTNDAADYEQACRSFWELYFGRLALVEDKEVAGAMESFGCLLDPDMDPEAECDTRGAKRLEFADDRTSLKARSLAIAEAAKTLIAANWNVDDGRSRTFTLSDRK